MYHIVALLGHLALNQHQYKEGLSCLDPVHEGWCARSFECTDLATEEVVQFARVRRMPDFEPVDTSIVAQVRNVCVSHNMELPSVHTDLANWCLFEAGLYGSKGRVPLGMEINNSSPKGWHWLDGSAV